MADEASLLRAVLDDPDSDAPRLAYADGVGGPRADFIRAQVAMAVARKTRKQTADWAELYDREQRLLAQYGETWAGPIKNRVARWGMWRGFVEEIALDAPTFLKDGAELYQLAPILHLDLSGVAPLAAEVFASPLLDRLVSLDVSRNALGDAGAIALAASPHLGKLEWLNLSSNAIGTPGLEALATSQNLPKLAYLGFKRNAVDDPTPRAGGVEDNMIHDMSYQPLGEDLIQKFGDKRWLSWRVYQVNQYPPGRDAAGTLPVRD